MILPQSIVNFEKVSKNYYRGQEVIHAVHDVNLTITSGENLVILGPSGSGKSTLLQLMGCLDVPTSGCYQLFGTDVTHLDDVALSHIRATKIGFVFQSFYLISQLTVFENIALPLYYQPTPPSDIKKRVDFWIEKVGLIHRREHYPNQLSGGEMQRVAIARSMIASPQIILADEPTGNLDRETGRNIIKLLLDLNNMGTTLVIVTHDEDIAQSFSRKLRFQDGRIKTHDSNVS